MNAQQGLSRGGIPLLLGMLALGLASALARAGDPPGRGAEPLANDAVDYNLPRRIVCRASPAITVRTQSKAMLIEVVPVAGKVVASAAELKDGQCAGLKTPENELPGKTYGAFGPKVIGPLRIYLGNSQVEPQVTVRKDGSVSNLDVVSVTSGQPLQEGTVALRNVLQWVQSGRGSINLLIDRDSQEPRVGFFGRLDTLVFTKL